MTVVQRCRIWISGLQQPQQTCSWSINQNYATDCLLIHPICLTQYSVSNKKKGTNIQRSIPPSSSLCPMVCAFQPLFPSTVYCVQQCSIYRPNSQCIEHCSFLADEACSVFQGIVLCLKALACECVPVCVLTFL